MKIFTYSLCVFALIHCFAPIQAQSTIDEDPKPPAASQKTIIVAFKEFECLYNALIKKYAFLINEETGELNTDDNTINKIIKLGFKSYISPTELFIETLKPCYDAFIAKTADSTCKTLTTPGIYLGVGYLRTWWTVMQLPNDFHAMILLDQEIPICLFNAFERLLLLISRDYDDYQTFFEYAYDEALEGERLSDQSKLNRIIQFFTFRQTYSIEIDINNILNFLPIYDLIYNACVRDICSQDQSTLPKDIQSSSKLVNWVNHKITHEQYNHLKSLVNTGNVHIVNTDLLDFQAIAPLLNAYAKQGLYLKLIDISNIINISLFNQFLAWTTPNNVKALEVLNGHVTYKVPFAALLEWLEKCYQHHPAGYPCRLLQTNMIDKNNPLLYNIININNLIKLARNTNAQSFLENKETLQPVGYATALKECKGNLKTLYNHYCPLLLIHILKNFYLNPCILTIQDPSDIGKTLSEIRGMPFSDNFHNNALTAILYYLNLYNDANKGKNVNIGPLRNLDGFFLQLLSDLFKQPKKHETEIAHSSFDGGEDDDDSDQGSNRIINTPPQNITNGRPSPSNLTGYHIVHTCSE